ncbi:S-adenosyl-L-methionine-dependent methyltransferase [Myriangium duriaei CBS 260.36]|uniref:S-adenosyl-L-methionine-dependent methyltransferase n=1 Tax=Myriangium duriaei CBS 260.36 TaxID=1168546 RepID=A0A9P4MEG5_9PEZI|nr:S-adenosyl-L-methionine-dependent methyltransferase [Myriangium duriaei CBS 260.36]
MEKVNALIDQIAVSASTLTQVERNQVTDRLRDLSISLEDLQMSARRVLYSPLQLMALRVGCDIGLWKILCDGKRAFTTDELSRTTNVAPLLMGRLLRYMASVRLIQETDKDEFAANNVTQTFAISGYDSAVRYQFDHFAKAVAHTPTFLKERGYKDVDDSKDCPFPTAHGSDLLTFDFLAQKHPKAFEHFHQFMVVHRWGMPTWLDTYPYKQAAEGLDPERVFFVDIGGGFGHQSVALRKMLPDLTSRIVVQDLAATLKDAPEHAGVEMMAYDFFEPQQIKGAKIYYLRNVLHDWPDDRAVTILANVREAMSPDSVLLIDETYLPTQNVHWGQTQRDLTMMVTLSAIERTESLWNDLLDKSGLKLQKLYPYIEWLGDCVLECVVV